MILGTRSAALGSVGAQLGSVLGGGASVEELAAGHPARRRTIPFPEGFQHVRGVVDLVLPSLSLSAIGEVRVPVTGAIDLALEGLLLDASGHVRVLVSAEMSATLMGLEVQASGQTLTKADAKEQRLLDAYRALPKAKQAELSKLLLNPRDPVRH